MENRKVINLAVGLFSIGFFIGALFAPPTRVSEMGKLSAERVLAIRDAIGLGYGLSTEAAYELIDGIATLEAELAKAEADKQIAVEALRSIKNLELDPTNPEAFARRLRQILAQALSRIEEKPGYDAGIEVGGTTHHRIEEP